MQVRCSLFNCRCAAQLPCWSALPAYQLTTTAQNVRVLSAGSNALGQLGLGFNTPSEGTRGLVEGFSGQTVASMRASLAASYLLLQHEDHSTQLFVMGSRMRGQLGLPPVKAEHEETASAVSLLSRASPASIELDASDAVKSVAVGYEHALVLTRARHVFATGANPDGQLGLGHHRDAHAFTPVIVPPEVDAEEGGVVSIHAGADTSAFVTARGALWTFGNSEYGQAMHGRVIDKVMRPMRVGTLGDRRIVDWQCSGSSSFALDGASASYRAIAMVMKRCRGHMKARCGVIEIKRPATNLIFGCSAAGSL